MVATRIRCYEYVSVAVVATVYICSESEAVGFGSVDVRTGSLEGGTGPAGGLRTVVGSRNYRATVSDTGCVGHVGGALWQRCGRSSIVYLAVQRRFGRSSSPIRSIAFSPVAAVSGGGI